MMTSRWPAQARELWSRLRAHDFDVRGAALPFSRRLARDNHWSPAFADAVLEEYRRFCFLAVTAGHPVTPSDEVDQAWHLHLLYTRDYWGTFCPEVLRYDLHHGPTKGGAAQGGLFLEQYSRTRHSYLRWFGEHPRADVWPDAETRFGRDTRWVRVNRDDVHLVPRLLPKVKQILPRALAWSGALLLAGSVAAQDSRPDSIWDAGGNPFALSAGGFLTFFFVACVAVALITALIGRSKYRAISRGRGVGQMPADIFETAMMFGGDVRVLEVTLARLVDEGRVRVAGSKLVPESPPLPSDHPLLRSTYELIDGGKPKIVRLLRRLRPDLRSLRAALQDKELMIAPGRLPRWPWLVGLLFPIAFAVARIVPAHSAGRPYGFLVLLAIACVFVSVIAHIVVWRKNRGFTEGGLEARKKMQAAVGRSGGDEGLLQSAAVLGTGALAGTALADLGTVMRPPSSGADGAGGCGDGGGGGGGGCGGGGGGCGG